jgi:predicted Fe-Mo cluster-binding NifX family protein
MKICVTSQGDTLDSGIDMRFGRCVYFLFVDTDSLAFEAVKNPYTEAPGGAGIDSVLLVAGRGAKAVLTGHCGPNAFHALQAAGIEVFLGIAGTVRKAVELYKEGGMEASVGPDVIPESGINDKQA